MTNIKEYSFTRKLNGITIVIIIFFFQVFVNEYEKVVWLSVESGLDCNTIQIWKVNLEGKGDCEWRTF